MTPGRGSCCPLLLLLLFSLVGLFTTCALAGQNTTAAAEKAGTCPQVEAEVEVPGGNCTEECQSDAGCEENKKCCRRAGCGTSCQVPDVRPGSCPNVDVPIPPLGLCRTTCQSDTNCQEGKKCCRNGCGFMTCETPRF
ncbi:waprin-Phi1-like [Erythrolamprus reginae]|uniref:waprin-Phi1-like n=1 Tax=Erythrolamprus reginae TaxID=121349 RepID=UPI00396CC11C